MRCSGQGRHQRDAGGEPQDDRGIRPQLRPRLPGTRGHPDCRLDESQDTGSTSADARATGWDKLHQCSPLGLLHDKGLHRPGHDTNDSEVIWFGSRQTADLVDGCGFHLFHYGVPAPKTENPEPKIHLAMARLRLHHAGPGGVPAATAILCAVGRDRRPHERPFLGGFVLYHYDPDGLDRHRIQAEQPQQRPDPICRSLGKKGAGSGRKIAEKSQKLSY